MTVFALPFGWAVIGARGRQSRGRRVHGAARGAGPAPSACRRWSRPAASSARSARCSVIGIVIVMYVGFLVVEPGAGRRGARVDDERECRMSRGIALVGVLSVIAAIYGYDLIHAYTRVMTYVSAPCSRSPRAGSSAVHGLPGGFPGPQRVQLAGVPRHDLDRRALADRLRSVRVGLLPLHAARHRRAARLLGKLLGLHAGSFLPMVLGAAVGLAAPKANLIAGLAHADGRASRRSCSSCSPWASRPPMP